MSRPTLFLTVGLPGDRGAACELRYHQLTAAEQGGRIDRRQAEEPEVTWPMSDEELARWAGVIEVPTPAELDGSEPIDLPPSGFPTWDEWRTRRWPPSVDEPDAGQPAQRRIGDDE